MRAALIRFTWSIWRPPSCSTSRSQLQEWTATRCIKCEAASIANLVGADVRAGSRPNSHGIEPQCGRQDFRANHFLRVGARCVFGEESATDGRNAVRVGDSRHTDSDLPIADIQCRLSIGRGRYVPLPLWTTE